MAYSDKVPINKVLRHNEYYGMQESFDNLYERSKNGEHFCNLMDLVLSDSNLKLAFRNMKANKGSKTPGTDNLNIENIKKLSEVEVLERVRKIVTGKRGYNPKPVRRVMIPKPNGKLRPLGIPCIWDRLIQQAMKQVIEPILEAKFNKHSFGFRPLFSAENAIGEVCRLINRSGMRYMVKVDIVGFFDNVNHSKLIRKLWTLGIRDKHLIYVIRQMLKSEIEYKDGRHVRSEKGTPQGGIISPILANAYLHEIDEWLMSQWECNPIENNYKVIKSANGTLKRSKQYNHQRKHTNLKEIYGVRYADDLVVFTRTKDEAERILHALRERFKVRLKLEVSEEKSEIINLTSKKGEFLGFDIGCMLKKNKYVAETHMCKKRIKSISRKLVTLVRSMKYKGNGEERNARIMRFNATVLGVQNYFRIANMISIDLDKVAYKVEIAMVRRLGIKGSRAGGELTNTGRELSDYEKLRFGKTVRMKYDSITGRPLYPISFVQMKNPTSKSPVLCLYTKEGRSLIHRNLSDINPKILKDLMINRDKARSIEYQDNKISRYTGQLGVCAVTKYPFESIDEMACHHVVPVANGGSDEYENLRIIKVEVHRLIHASKKKTIERLLSELNLTNEELKKVNTLRIKAGLCEIKQS